ncbi:hypothetical protein SEA_GIBBLES_5 [Gordonia phage Gibbles]|nr:hypothetical protein SEA_GIBBLES_5 [Gordonia phage Gibbles]
MKNISVSTFIKSGEYPVTMATAKAIYESLPTEDESTVKVDWDCLTDEQKVPFITGARNLGYVFPDEYPQLADELARFNPLFDAERKKFGDNQ